MRVLPLLGKEPHQLRFLERRAAEVALEFVAAFGAQEVELLAVLHALGDDAHAQAVRHRDDGARDGDVVAVVRQVAHLMSLGLAMLRLMVVQTAASLNMPNLGSNMPNMGRTMHAPKRRSGLADALFSRTQQAVLGLLFGQPDRSFYATEIMAKVGAGSGAVQRELARLEESGLATVRRLGTQKHYQANPDSPLFAELCSIAQKTVGIAEPLRRALKDVAPQIIAAFVFGSLAKRSDSALSDIDIMIVSDSLAYADVFPALEAVREKLGRAINPTVYTRREWTKRVKEQNSFVVRVMDQPKIWLFGSADELRA